MERPAEPARIRKSRPRSRLSNVRAGVVAGRNFIIAPAPEGRGLGRNGGA
jgi:hypothetical protein